jgi:hypothetical protein
VSIVRTCKKSQRLCPRRFGSRFVDALAAAQIVNHAGD